ncbi:hypothetical protein HAX54_049896, partial [Datura stramonium]|nr:hypothetical protein [Datura stramonium]
VRTKACDASRGTEPKLLDSLRAHVRLKCENGHLEFMAFEMMVFVNGGMKNPQAKVILSR